jgi:hypothetical protein
VSLSEADLDLLADYSEGLLHGAEAERVAGLIASDDEWALTYRLLTGASTKIDHALDAYAQQTLDLPVDVSRKIDDAIHNERERKRLAAPVSIDAARKRSDEADGKRSRRQGAQAARRRRESWGGWVGVSAAAAVIIAVVFGLSALGLNLGGSSKSSSSSTSAVAPQDAGSAALPPITSSGANYTKANLGEKAGKPLALSPNSGTKATGSQSGAPAIGADPAFRRFTSAPDLANCLAAVTTAHGGHATAVDYARYEGQAALIITLTNPDLRVAVGPACGLPSSGPDQLGMAFTR